MTNAEIDDIRSVAAIYLSNTLKNSEKCLLFESIFTHSKHMLLTDKNVQMQTISAQLCSFNADTQRRFFKAQQHF